MKKYIVETSYTFKVKWEIVAKSSQEALNIAVDDCEVNPSLDTNKGEKVVAVSENPILFREFKMPKKWKTK